MNKPFVQQLFTGKVKKMGDPNAKDPMARPWESGIFKTETEGQVWLTKTGLIGDEVADKKNHGGPEKALFAYPIKHYHPWRVELALDTIGVGAMGENLALLHMDEHSVCIGDTYQLGEAIIQVSQPRRPCWKPARRFGVIDFAVRIQTSGRTGWYFRVLTEGYISSRAELHPIDRPYPEWTIAACNDIMYQDKENIEATQQLASCELLATNWRNSFAKRLDGQPAQDDIRLFGPNRE